MITAEVQFYDVVLFFHIAAAVLAFGPTFGYAIFQTVAERVDPRAIPTVMRAMTVTDRYLVTPASIVVLAAGIYLVADRWEFDAFFVSAGLVAIIALLGLVHGFFIPHERKLAALAERDAAASGTGEPKLSDEYWTVSKQVGIVGTVAGLIVILTIYFMTAKPFL